MENPTTGGGSLKKQEEQLQQLYETKQENLKRGYEAVPYQSLWKH